MVGHTQYDFSGETAIVTGSTKGIGRGIATGLADADANVVVNSRTESEVNSTIRMNAVSTDVTETAQLRHEAEQDAADDPDRTAEEILRARGERRPLGRLGQPEDLADAVLWLASDRADYVVGDIVRVSGGGNLE